MRNNNLNHSRPVVHATQNLGERIPQKFLAEIKARAEAAHDRFVKLESLWQTALACVRDRGSRIPREWTPNAWPAIRTLAGTVGEFDQTRYTEACHTLEWAANSPADFREARELMGVK